MPELPEVETVCRGIHPHIAKKIVKDVVLRRPTLRWPIPADLPKLLINQPILDVSRRAKYLLVHFPHGKLLIHLGMSGRLCVFPANIAHKKHDHVDIYLNNDTCLRFTDPRRFGAILWTEAALSEHPLLAAIGPEPLTDELHADYLFNLSRKRKLPIKAFIMDSKVVAGVGNIYATESLFLARIAPHKAASKISLSQYQELVIAIKAVLNAAIKQGGTTLKDFKSATGAPGYFSLALKVYGREGKACFTCDSKLIGLKIGQRSTVYCKKCQR